MQLNRLFVICATVAVIGYPIFVNADTVTLGAIADATLIETAPDNSSGGNIFFNAGTTQNNTRNRGLFQFDVTSIPQNALVTGVSLQLEVTRAPVDGFESSPFSLHRMLRSWGEGTTVPLNNPGGLGGPAAPGDATWNYRFAFDQPWGQPGGAPDVDYSSASSGAIIMYGPESSPYAFESTSEAVADVQFWLQHPESNFGWMLMTDFEDTPFTARRFASREDPLGRGPMLTIDYVVIPEPSSVAILALGAVFFASPLLGRFWR